MSVIKGQWVQIRRIILAAGERAPSVPEDTKEVPLELRVKGFLLEEKSEVGEMVTVETASGRKVSGKLETVEPAHEHNFGDYIPELSEAGNELTRWLTGGDNDER
ncbi:2-amino-4-ketopentanoate thiolase [Mesotoga sp. H07pep.5.4]|uniref:2-amino-4-oxopentanoate thiolase subunit OrtA n=1 Tax=Mesotoga sp. H07pep.5.4 TaxID=1463664 RepID=UPI000EF1531B|nr:2-amino-4-oxopentanoate thiolase subunit OrtA [Mesotoga sp. H07pep.5.4]RLL85988.1 2-amino-4-ketopentanoate thiolase [Mesotoga sp. H07pep.5.4]